MKTSRGVPGLLLPAAVGALLLLLWHEGVKLSGTIVIPTPLQVLRGLEELARQGRLMTYAGDSLVRVLSGYTLAVLLGIPAGLMMGLHTPSARVAGPLVQVLRPISPLAWSPVAILLFGVADSATRFLIFLSALFPIVAYTREAVQRVPGIYLRAGRNLGLGRVAMLRRVIFPAILPSVLTGLRITLGIAWLVVVAAEMLGTDSGLGYLIIDARNAGKRYDLVIGGMLLIGGIGLGLDLAMRQIERARAVRWAFHRED
ncbi:ABC transporter permease [Melittangium boletus]|uniref:Binding-protein-dependent transport systems inner membrane component n=1 Tax=Melittangium boletus DSM 14713 TaxID=1294270 RepID=A0A250IJF2_9BACT|nr:ABC transporter permease [Melittangium boletus]ATB31949.1 binding-protein-dependent transport systems inner membrane component [Melittangium boletus DSM 14713]